MPEVTLAQVRQAFKAADTFSTEVGEFRQEVVIPVHNQLRNAGFHIVNALNDDGSVKSPDHHLYDARDHCRRAAYDAAVAGIISARAWIYAFREDYRGIAVSDVVPAYPDIVLRERKARDLIGAGRYDEKSDGERMNDYMEAFRALRADVDLLDANREGLDAKKLAMRRDMRWTTLRGVAAIFSAVGGFIGMLLAALTVYLTHLMTRGAPPP